MQVECSAHILRPTDQEVQHSTLNVLQDEVAFAFFFKVLVLFPAVNVQALASVVRDRFASEWESGVYRTFGIAERFCEASNELEGVRHLLTFRSHMVFGDVDMEKVAEKQERFERAKADLATALEIYAV